MFAGFLAPLNTLHVSQQSEGRICIEDAICVTVIFQSHRPRTAQTKYISVSNVEILLFGWQCKNPNLNQKPKQISGILFPSEAANGMYHLQLRAMK